MVSEIIIDNKKYIILPKEEFEALTKKQVLEKYKGELLTFDEAKERTKERMEKWAKS